jgi:hypothetical protein
VFPQAGVPRWLHCSKLSAVHRSYAQTGTGREAVLWRSGRRQRACTGWIRLGGAPFRAAEHSQEPGWLLLGARRYVAPAVRWCIHKLWPRLFATHRSIVRSKQGITVTSQAQPAAAQSGGALCVLGSPRVQRWAKLTLLCDLYF